MVYPDSSAVEYPADPAISVVGRNEDMFRTLRPHIYEWTWLGTEHVQDIRQRITIPAGFEFDGASIPRLVRPFWGRWSLGRWSVLLHDWPYRFSGFLPAHSWERWQSGNWVQVDRRMLRSEADRLMGRVMRQERVPRWRRRAAYRGISIGAGRAWCKGTGRLTR